MNFGSPILSMLVLLSYLSAAFVDCETAPSRIGEPISVGRAVHSMPAPSPHGDASRARTDVEGAPSHGHHDHPGHHPDQQSRDVEMAHEHGHSMKHDAPAEASGRSAEQPRPAHAGRPPLELKPKCVCGCSETRSTIGGSTSRLGSVVPAIYLSRLIEAETQGTAFGVAEFARRLPFDLDPIPI